ncbi:homocysteine S-methyltransferase [Streptomyces sp. 549]|uniref:homocysteine S-methyltransferase n=1 Tax=Streptomyces sp. 549 TaxID=3049076 RepID=UPI0024C3AD53|nr:homocysteine S-methyltransferase [Streptomyces sp. 549]MDK1476644.1 homocysteine S-methyltransferase [Streptomyces sp. 549]
MTRPALPLADALAQGPQVLDGGLAHQLAEMGNDLSDELWSARLLTDAPEQIAAAHAAYARAGARVHITASYQASFEGFARRGINTADAERLFARSVHLARSALATPAGHAPGRESATDPSLDPDPFPYPGPFPHRDPASVPGPEAGWVAASVGPYGAVLADGSEYRGRYGLSTAELVRFHRPRVAALAAAEPDVLALETVPDVREAEALLRAVEGCGLPVWLSYTVAHGRTRAGQSLEEAFGVAAGIDQVIAVGVNCCLPEDADAAVPLAVAASGKPAVVYPNSGEHWDAVRRGWQGTPTFEPAAAARWRASGARLIGGCCRVGAPHIARIAAQLGGPAAGRKPR